MDGRKGSLIRVRDNADALGLVVASEGESPTRLPDGKHFLYFHPNLDSEDDAGIYVGTTTGQEQKKRVLATGFAAQYAAGHLFFMQDGNLMRQRFNADALELEGEPIVVAEHVGTIGWEGKFSVSENALAYQLEPVVPGVPHIAWFDRDGKTSDLIGDEKLAGIGSLFGLALSPDGIRAAGRDLQHNSNGDIWLLDLIQGVRTRFTFDSKPGSYPVWSPNGGSIVFAGGNHSDTLIEKAANGSGKERILLRQPDQNLTPTSWSHDGKFLLYTSKTDPSSDGPGPGRYQGQSLWVLPLFKGGKPTRLFQPPFSGSYPTNAYGSFSPDGRWVAYLSNEAGQMNVFVRRFIDVALGPSLSEEMWQISKDGAGGPGPGTNGVPIWRGDGKEIFFRARDGSPMSVEVNGSGEAFQSGTPKQLFAAPNNNGWDMNSRFLMSVAPSAPTLGPVFVVLNWQADLKNGGRVQK
ncbi:MAG: hypothetical protein ABI824_09750 [Acidobacteriota bacterium]